MKKVFILLILLISFGTVFAKPAIYASSITGSVYDNSKEKFIENPNCIGIDISLVDDYVYVNSSSKQVYRLVEPVGSMSTDEGIEFLEFRAIALHLNGEVGIIAINLDQSGVMHLITWFDTISLYYKAKVYEVTE